MGASPAIAELVPPHAPSAPADLPAQACIVHAPNGSSHKRDRRAHIGGYISFSPRRVSCMYTHEPKAAGGARASASDTAAHAVQAQANSMSREDYYQYGPNPPPSPAVSAVDLRCPCASSLSSLFIPPSSPPLDLESHALPLHLLSPHPKGLVCCASKTARLAEALKRRQVSSTSSEPRRAVVIPTATRPVDASVSQPRPSSHILTPPRTSPPRGLGCPATSSSDPARL